MGKVDLLKFETALSLAQAAAREWAEGTVLSKPEQPCCAAFSGGRIAEMFFDAITLEVRQRNSNLAGVRFFWADERCVPPDHPQSNYRLMGAHLLGPLKVPDGQVHRIKGELGPTAAAHEASREYSTTVRASLDFVFLGMGEDGHIASIFPGDPLQESPGEAYRAVLNAPKPPPERVTLAAHAMVAARNVWVLVSGEGKEYTLGKALKGPETPLGKLLEMRDFTRVLTNVAPK